MTEVIQWTDFYDSTINLLKQRCSDVILNTIRNPLLVSDFGDLFIYLLNSYAFGKETVQVIGSTTAEER